MSQQRQLQFATQCLYLKISLGAGPSSGGLINLCQHIIRDGRECVGPFLDETETTCGLWEIHPRFEGRQSTLESAR